MAEKPSPALRNHDRLRGHGPGHSLLRRLFAFAHSRRSGAHHRRTLEIRFKKTFRRTILETIQQTHLQEALRLLRETHLNMTDVCYQAGFPNPQRFNETIKAETGFTPLAYRKQFQPG